MPVRPRLVSLWRNLFERDRVEQGLTEELHAYVEMLVEAKIRQGLRPSEARRAAMIEAGGVEQVKESVREVRMGRTLEAIRQDLRYGVRMLLKYPGFTCVAALTLALGIGANTAIFQLLDRIRAIPGVEAVAIAHEIPLRGSGGASIRMDGADAQQGGNTSLSRVGPDYFKTLEISLLAGRDFDARDGAVAPKVAIVNEAFTRRFSNGATPVGRRFRIAAATDAPETLYEIVGLVRDIKYGDLREEFVPVAYTAPAQDPRSGPGGRVLIRSRLPQSETVAAVKRVLDEINPAITVSFQGFKPMIEATVLRERLMAALSSIFGLLALLLACIGLYGILSYGVASRTNEIGIRMALGAKSRDVLWLILREALVLVVVGVAAGLPMIFAVTRLASALLFGLTPTDPVSLLSAALLMLVVAMVAAYLPARRATRVDPIAALRCE